MSAPDLRQLSVLNTRPEHQQQMLATAIEAANGKSVSFPLMSIVPVTDKRSLDRIRQQILQLDRFDKIVFVSTNAVAFGSQWIDEYWPQLPVRQQYYAIGPTTAAAAEAALNVEVHGAHGGMTSETILALPGMREVEGERIGIFRGCGGREILAETLRERGAEVEYIEVYLRQPVSHAPGECNNLLRSQAIDAIIISSGETLDSLIAACADNKAIVSLIPLIVPSERVAQLGRDVGFKRVENARGADAEAIITALAGLADSL